jgi:anti-sigma factor RsiW
MSSRLRCAEVDVLLADYVDQTLLDREAGEVKAHLSECAMCRELAADAAAAVAFMDRAAVVEPPPELVNKILFEIGVHAPVKAPLWQRLFGKGRLQQALQPRLLLRTSSVNELADLHPANVYAAAEDKVTRWWDRGVKHYQSMKLVFEIQAKYQEWLAEQERAGQDKQGDKQ